MTKTYFAIFIGFWLVFLFFYLMEGPVHQILVNDRLVSLNLRKFEPFIRLKSEYTLGEQLTKFYLFSIMLISIYAYKCSQTRLQIKESISFLSLGFVMYLAESNMIDEATHPVFGFILLTILFYLLSKSRSWLSLGLLLFGFFIVSLGVMTDYISEKEWAQHVFPHHIINFLGNMKEERFDVAGVGFLCLSTIFHFLDPIKRFIKNNLKGTLWLCLGSGLITSGNGFLHYQYEPGRRLTVLALGLTISGYLILIGTNKKILNTDQQLTLIKEGYFYIFIFFFFVLSPTVFGQRNEVSSIILWLPTIMYAAFYLFNHHPLLLKEKI